MVRHLALALLVVVGAEPPARAAPRAAPPAAPAAASAPAPAAVPAAGADKTVQRLVPPFGCDRITIAEGLPNPNVRRIIQDPRGFMWFGTADGVARYDGHKMRVYRADEDDPKSISSGYITAMELDPSGKLWVGTTEGANLYDPETDQFTRFARGKGGPGTEGVAAIARDPKDRVWLAMSGGGLSRFDPASGSFTEFATKPLDVPITAIHADKAGNLWLGTATEGVLRWNPDTNAATSFKDDLDLGAVAINAVLAASSGKVWIGSEGDGLFELDPASRKLKRHEHSAQNPGTISTDYVSVLFEDKNRALWIGTPNGLNRMDAAGRIVRYMFDPKDPKDPTKLAFPTVESIYQDAGGVMWVGGFTVGLCKFDEARHRFGHYRTQSQVKGLFEDGDGTLWVGTNNGLYKYEWPAQRVTTYHNLGRNLSDEDPVSLESVWISTLHRDRRGTLWMGIHRNGLVAFDPKTESYRRYVPDPEKPNSIPIDIIFDIWEDERGMLWLATWGSGLLRFDPQLETFTAFTTNEAGDDPNSLTSNHIYNIYVDPTEKNVLWLGAGKGGLIRFSTAAGTAKAYRYRADDPTSLSSDDVLSIYRDPSGSIWVGTFGGGLNRLDLATGKAERFTASNSGLTNNIIHGILPDPDGKLWLSTNGAGLVHFDPKTGKFLAYDTSDGVQDVEFSQSSYLLSKSGKLIFGGVGGFNVFLPKEIVRDAYVPPVVMTGFKVFNQEISLDRPIWTLPPLEVSYSDSFELQFAALAFAAPQKNRFAYKLEGFDDDFIETDRPFATYTKLDGGNYTLRIRAANRHGAWNEAGIALKLKVTPPLWRTWPAYGVYVLLLAAAAYLVIRMQRARVQRAEREGRLAVVERDLELTGAVQTGFLPEHNEIHTQHLQLFGFYRPADACSGDWWWYEPLPGGRHLILVGDVTGHGPGPAMVTAAVATAFRVLIEDGLDNVQFGLERLNREVLRVAKGKYHMTMAALELDDATGEWMFYSAGAPPMLSLNQNGKHKVHFCPGSPLGTETGFETGRVQGRLGPSERILLYTDGIPEIILPNGNVMGMRRFAQQYELTRGQRLRDAAASILLHADQIRGNEPQTDDWTFAMIEWN